MGTGGQLREALQQMKSRPGRLTGLAQPAALSTGQRWAYPLSLAALQSRGPGPLLPSLSLADGAWSAAALPPPQPGGSVLEEKIISGLSLWGRPPSPPSGAVLGASLGLGLQPTALLLQSDNCWASQVNGH